MINIFEMSKKLIEKLNNPTKEYWEKEPIEWNREAIAPDGSTYNEQELFEAIRESDKQRLLRFG